MNDSSPATYADVVEAESIVGWLRYTVTCDACGEVVEFEADPAGDDVTCDGCFAPLDTDGVVDAHLQVDCTCGEVFDVERSTGTPVDSCPGCEAAYRITEER